MNNESGIELAIAPFIKNNLARKSKFERVKRYLHLFGVGLLIILYFLLIGSSIVKFFLQGQNNPEEPQNSNLYSALDTLSNQVIRIQGTSSNSEPITIKINGTGFKQNTTKNLS